MQESDIIKLLQQRHNHPSGIGDDAALLSHKSSPLLISKDVLVEGIHFKTSYFSPEDLAHKSLHVNISDIVAMGGIAQKVLLGISIPPNISSKYLTEFLNAFSQICRDLNIEIIGGDTTASVADFFISITIIGTPISENTIKKRSTANEKDIIAVAGNLGYSKLGLYLLQNNIHGHDIFKNSHLRPKALMEEGLFLAKSPHVNAMMDVSDGLYSDIRKLCETSNCGAKINLNTPIITKELQNACNKLKLSTQEYAFIGGEDYALLFTVSKEFYPKLAREFQQKFSCSVSKVGVITSSQTIEWEADGKLINFPYPHKEFNHF